MPPITSPAPGMRGISSRPSADTMRSINTPLTTVHARTHGSPCRISVVPAGRAVVRYSGPSTIE